MFCFVYFATIKNKLGFLYKKKKEVGESKLERRCDGGSRDWSDAER